MHNLAGNVGIPEEFTRITKFKWGSCPTLWNDIPQDVKSQDFIYFSIIEELAYQKLWQSYSKFDAETQKLKMNEVRIMTLKKKPSANKDRISFIRSKFSQKLKIIEDPGKHALNVGSCQKSPRHRQDKQD